MTEQEIMKQRAEQRRIERQMAEDLRPFADYLAHHSTVLRESFLQLLVSHGKQIYRLGFRFGYKEAKANRDPAF